MAEKAGICIQKILQFPGFGQRVIVFTTNAGSDGTGFSGTRYGIISDIPYSRRSPITGRL